MIVANEDVQPVQIKSVVGLNQRTVRLIYGELLIDERVQYLNKEFYINSFLKYYNKFFKLYLAIKDKFEEFESIYFKE